MLEATNDINSRPYLPLSSFSNSINMLEAILSISVSLSRHQKLLVLFVL